MMEPSNAPTQAFVDLSSKQTIFGRSAPGHFFSGSDELPFFFPQVAPPT
jgi:hypothetical protein